MFCGNCGQQLIEGAKFCDKCGTQVVLAGKTANVAPTSSKSVDFMSLGVLKVLMAVAVIWSVFSGFVPVVEGRVPFTLSVEWNFFSMREDFAALEHMGVELGVINIISVVCMGAYILGILFACSFFYKLILSKDEKNLSSSSVNASLLPLVATIAMMIGQAIINKETASYMMGIEFLSVLPSAWVTIVIAAINVFLLVPAYKKAVEGDRKRENNGSKECMMCHTVYTGEKCPQCDSVFVVK